MTNLLRIVSPHPEEVARMAADAHVKDDERRQA